MNFWFILWLRGKQMEDNNIIQLNLSQNVDKKETKPLKVLMAMDTYLPDVDGVINSMHNYCNELSKYCEVTALAPKHKKQDKVNVNYKILRCKSVYVPIIRNYYGKPNKDKQFINQVMQGDYDIIHVHSPFRMAKFCVKVAKQKNIPAVITFHTNIKAIIKKYAKFNWLTNLILKKIGKIYNQYDMVYAVSDMVASQARECGYTGKICLLPLGTELKKSTSQEIDANRIIANKQFNLNEDELVFLYVGRVVTLKRIDFTLKALKIVKDKGYKFKFFIVGRGEALEKLKRLTQKLGLTDEVIFTGFIDRELFPVINSRADLFLFPSLYDNFGLVKVEASAYNTAGVFVKGSCAGAEVIDNYNGFLTSNDLNNYADTIIRAISDKENLKKVGVTAGQTLYTNWEDCSKELYKAYLEILKEKNEDNANK